MPEGPEVRRNADALQAHLGGKPLISVMARTKAARHWLVEHPDTLIGRRITRICSKGKNLVGFIEGGFYFYAHRLMWGRWHIDEGSPPEAIDRRERARIIVPDAFAILFSAPVFELGEGDPFQTNEYLCRLGPDTLPYAEDGPFDTAAFLHRLLSEGNSPRAIGAALLDQRISAGIGNYLRAEILFACRIDPWRLVGDLSARELECLCETVPTMAESAYRKNGRTTPDDVQSRMNADPTLCYPSGTERRGYHYVFRRTNLPCVVCGDTIRQKRQVTWEDEEGERERIIYFCPTCQKPSIEPTWMKTKRAKQKSTLNEVINHQ